MSSALVVLAVLSALGGFLGVPAVLGGSNRFAGFLAPVLGHHDLHIEHATELGLMAISVAVAVGSMVLAWVLYTRDADLDRTLADRLGGAYRALGNAYYVDRFYVRGIAGSVVLLSTWLWKAIDVGVIDAIANGTATAAKSLGDSWRHWSTGNVQAYALTLLAGVVVLVTALALVAGG